MGFFGLCSHGGTNCPPSPLKISKTINDLSIKLSSQKHVSFVSIVWLFPFNLDAYKKISYQVSSSKSLELKWSTILFLKIHTIKNIKSMLKRTQKQVPISGNFCTIPGFFLNKLGCLLKQNMCAA